MKRTISTLVVGGLCFCAPLFSHASGALVITEIMYDLPGTDAEHEWIEIHNVSGSPVHIIGGSVQGSFRINDGSNHVLADSAQKGSMTIAADGYAIIASNAATFLADYPNFSGTVIDTTLSLPNASGTVKLIDGDGNILDSVSYNSNQGGSGDGNSLVLSGSSWAARIPTPGSGYSDSNSSAQTTSSSAPVQNSGGLPAPLTVGNQKAVEAPKANATIHAPEVTITGIPIEISSVVYGPEGRYREAGYFHYSLGDGSEYTTEKAEPFLHTYRFVGSYVIELEYRTNRYIADPELSARLVVDVRNPAVTLSLSQDGFVQIQNKSDDETDLSEWRVFSGTSTAGFSFPRGTILLPGKTITLSPEVSHLVLAQTPVLDLFLPDGVTKVSSYQGASVPLAASAAVFTKASGISGGFERAVQASSLTHTNLEEPQPQILTANTQDALPQSKNSGITWVFIAGLVGVMSGAVVAIWKFGIFKNFEPAPDASETQAIADTISIVED